MTISPLMVYLIFLADRVIDFFGFIAAGSVVAFVAAGMAGLFFDFETEAFKKRCVRIVKVSAITLVCAAAIATLIPRTSTMVAMLVIPPIANNEQVQQLPAEVLTWIRDQLKTKEM